MKPYYDKGGITVYCCDNRDLELPTCDLWLSDPPYHERTHQGARTSADWAKSGGNEAPALGIEFDAFTLNDLCAAFLRAGKLARRWVISFLDYRHVDFLEAYEPPGLRFVRRGLWVKPNAAPQFTGDRPGVGYEQLAILHAQGGRMRWNGGGRHGVWTHPVAHASHRISDHPNAKPIPLLAELIKDFSDPGDLVLDPYGGSGAVAAAAHLTGRRCVLVERDEVHCRALVHWLETGRPLRGGAAGDAPLLDLLEAA